MKFSGNPRGSSVHRDFPDVDIDHFVGILRSVSMRVGEATRERLHNTIQSASGKLQTEDEIPFWDTPIYGEFYVYLWFDLNGELFYIGKGIGNRAENMCQRSAEFKDKAASGYYKILASHLNEDYALDLEKILIMEAVRCGKNLLNRTGGDAIDAVHYCSGDRELLLWYWDYLGVISRFSELTGTKVFYYTEGVRVWSGYSVSALDGRVAWWGYSEMHPETNDPKRLTVIREVEEKERKRKEKARMYQQKRREELKARENGGLI